MLTLYKSPTCAYCPQVMKYLDTKGVEYTTVDITEDREAAQLLWDKGFKTVPVTTDGETYVAGPKWGEIAKLIRGE